MRELRLHEVDDPRGRRGRRWRLDAMLAMTIVGIVAGCTSMRELEWLTARLPRSLAGSCRRPAAGGDGCAARAARCRAIRLGGRLPDTTLRDVLVRLCPTALRSRLHHQIRLAHRRKALKPDGLPCGVVSVDGRGTSTPFVDDRYAQRQHNGENLYGVVRTVTCSLVSSAARVCIDAFPIPAKTNEMGVFGEVFAELERAYGASDLYEIVMGDAGNCSLANATLVDAADKGYVFQVKADSQPTLAVEMDRMLGRDVSEAHHVESERIGGANVTRYLWISTELAGFGDWTHLRTVLRVRRVVTDDDGGIVSTGDRWYVSNVPINRFTRTQWLAVIRRRWAVENECHDTFDRLLREDEQPWILDPQGMVVVMLLRRLAFNAMALFRSVTQRGEDQRRVPWRELMADIRLALLTATQELITGLRLRGAAVTEG